MENIILIKQSLLWVLFMYLKFKFGYNFSMNGSDYFNCFNYTVVNLGLILISIVFANEIWMQF